MRIALPGLSLTGLSLPDNSLSPDISLLPGISLMVRTSAARLSVKNENHSH
ncbi:MAG: hypothetical protein IPK79_06340 [Vampirovibrionales bacterium]|nr:hypothetical protein [Vampirovibrionales bacterium]